MTTFNNIKLLTTHRFCALYTRKGYNNFAQKFATYLIPIKPYKIVSLNLNI